MRHPSVGRNMNLQHEEWLACIIFINLMSYDSWHATIVKTAPSSAHHAPPLRLKKIGHTPTVSHIIETYRAIPLPYWHCVRDDPFGHHQKLSAKTQKTPNAEQGTAQKLGPCLPFQKTKFATFLPARSVFPLKGAWGRHCLILNAPFAAAHFSGSTMSLAWTWYSIPTNYQNLCISYN